MQRLRFWFYFPTIVSVRPSSITTLVICGVTLLICHISVFPGLCNSPVRSLVLEPDSSVPLLWLPTPTIFYHLEQWLRMRFSGWSITCTDKPLYLRGECLKTASAKACPSWRGSAWLCWLTLARCLVRCTRSWWLVWGMLRDSKILLSFSPHSSTLWLSARTEENPQDYYLASFNAASMWACTLQFGQ